MQLPFPVNAGHLSADLEWIKIGTLFRTADGLFKVTDIGTRTIVAITLGEKEMADPTWLLGPPYPVAETVFDEDDFAAIDPATN